MHRLFMLLLLVLVLLVVPLAPASAQEGELLWDLTEDFTVTDLGFQFMYPEGWVYGANNGIGLAETEEDLEALMDDDSETTPEGYTISLIAFDPADLQVEKDTELSDIVDTLMTTLDIEVTTSSPIELGVITRKSLTVLGTSKSGRAGILTVWQQSDVIVLFSMGMPEFSVNANYTWGNILGLVQPTGALELGNKPVQVSKLDVPFPDGWVSRLTVSEAYTIYEFEADRDNIRTPKGYVMFVFAYDHSLFKSNFKDKAFPETVDEVVEAFPSHDDTKPIITSEHIILDQQALTLKVEDQQRQDYWMYATYLLYDDTAIVIKITAPSEEKLNEIEPTWLYILNNIQESKNR